MGLRSFIPQKVNNKLVIGFYDFLRKADKIHHSRQVAKRNYINNQKAMENHQFNSSKEYIEDQHSYDDVKYGCVTVSYAGCEVISIYNAYVYYFGNDAVDFPKLLASFESDGMALNGFFGTAPKSIVHYLEAHGFKTEFYSDATASAIICFVSSFTSSLLVLPLAIVINACVTSSILFSIFFLINSSIPSFSRCLFMITCWIDLNIAAAIQ